MSKKIKKRTVYAVQYTVYKDGTTSMERHAYDMNSKEKRILFEFIKNDIEEK